MTDSYDCHVLILGGSFLGIELVRRLRRSSRGRALEIIVVDRQRRHPYIPLGHEILSRRLSFGVDEGTVLDSAAYVEGDRGQGRTRWEQGEIVGFDPESHTVTLGDGRSFSGRFVVVALGSEVRPPSHIPGGEHLVAYKSAKQLRECEEALKRTLSGPGASESPTIVVVGGGITGVEIGGELAHLARARPPTWRGPSVILVHGQSRLLPGLTPRAGQRAADALRAQGVNLRLETRLVSADEHSVTVRSVAGDETIPCALAFWSGGLQPPGVMPQLGLPTTQDGWLRVGPTLQCYPETTDEPEIFAGGDIARIYGGDGRWPTMQRAIEAIFAAETCARNILELAGHPPDYPDEVPPLGPHRLWTDFPHGVSVGGRSLIVYGRLVFPIAWFNIWFRRFLMRRYMARYSA